MKKGLLGFATNITANYLKIKVWVNSFKKYCIGDKIYLITGNASHDEIDLLKTLDINVYNVHINNNDLQFINHKRLYHTANILSKIDADYILVTDVFDVVFQNDPFKRLDFNMFDLFLTLEGVLVVEEPWNADVIKKVFPEYLKLCLNKQVICSGIICGKKENLIELFNSMYNLCENSSNDHNIKDQAALIVLDSIKSIYSRIKYLTLDDAWVINCAVAGPTDFFEAWGFKNIIKHRYKNIPSFKDGKVHTGNTLYDIVHQFNRIPDWNKGLIKNYE